MDPEFLYTLHYFPLYGRAEPLRLLLSHANVPYVNHHITFEDWPQYKPTMPGECMPCLEFLNGKKMGETKHIMKFLGKTHGYCPKDEVTDKKCDELIEFLMTKDWLEVNDFQKKS